MEVLKKKYLGEGGYPDLDNLSRGGGGPGLANAWGHLDFTD